MNQHWAQRYAFLFTLALLTSQVWSWFAAPQMDQALYTKEEAAVKKGRDAALLFKLLTPASSDREDRPVLSQQLPELSKDTPKTLAWGWNYPQGYAYSYLPFKLSIQLPPFYTNLLLPTATQYRAADLSRGPPALV